ncbi:dihydroorotate dehydrogenase [Bacillus sp. AFS088145]|uniref:dihydroorotate dehydrogenase n=1 Tax=Bacillus sp. AFS088145 TaxID=2033514 RepID=UPI000BF43597|nr:dihydroorotate dehydrogenase [Bacillus sp. AFS088145]PFH81742.1 dihydroorotate dehydrogenase [Bacillus sp. AFS088145]
MPDWSYHTIFKPMLSKLPSKVSREFIHSSMNKISTMPFGPNLIEFLGHLNTDSSLENEIHHLTIKNQIGLASKIDPYLSGTNAFMNLGFGVIEIGPISINDTYTSKSPLINLKHNQLIGTEENKVLTLEQTVHQLSKIHKKIPIFARIVGSFDEFKLIEPRLFDFVDLFILELDLAKNLVENNWASTKPICLSICPNEIDVFLKQENYPFDSILIEEIPNNTDLEQKNILINTIQKLKSNQFEKPIFTKGGVVEPIDAIELIDSGASLVFLTHGYVLSGPGLPKRINEAIKFRSKKAMTSLSDGWVWYFLFGLFMFIGGLLALFISLTSIVLPYDEHFLTIDRELILQFNDRILPFMSHDRMTLSGTIMSGGILFMSLARNGIKHHYHWAKKASDTSAFVGFLAIFLFIGYGYFDWLHALFWVILLIPFLIGFFKTRGINRSPESENLTNNGVWKLSLIGQLFFIILGFSIIIGGSIISFVGITTTFVKTDLTYLCISPSELNAFNQHLIPVISHDRAGFGGGLVSVGLLVLMISLWGFRQNHKWIWWTLLIGSLPAFITAFAVHFMIGYTDFYHLLPPIIASLFLLIGVITSYKFLNFTTNHSNDNNFPEINKQL